VGEVEPLSQGFWVKCRACAHCWIAAYFPAEVSQFVKIAARATCPKCGDRKPFIARQSEGVLLEEKS
jgi:hypothetical protein